MPRQTAEYRPIINKYPYVRSKKLTQAANGEVCTMGMPGCDYGSNTTVWAHANYDYTGKGTALKVRTSTDALHVSHAMTYTTDADTTHW